MLQVWMWMRWSCGDLRTRWRHVLLTCDDKVGEQQQAAAAEADGAVQRSQWRQADKTEGQFTDTQHCCSLQHPIHGYKKTTCTCRSVCERAGFLFASGWRSSGIQALCWHWCLQAMQHIPVNVYEWFLGLFYCQQMFLICGGRPVSSLFTLVVDPVPDNCLLCLKK